MFVPWREPSAKIVAYFPDDVVYLPSDDEMIVDQRQYDIEASPKVLINQWKILSKVCGLDMI